MLSLEVEEDSRYHTVDRRGVGGGSCGHGHALFFWSFGWRQTCRFWTLLRAKQSWNLHSCLLGHELMYRCRNHLCVAWDVAHPDVEARLPRGET